MTKFEKYLREEIRVAEEAEKACLYDLDMEFLDTGDITQDTKIRCIQATVRTGNLKVILYAYLKLSEIDKEMTL